MLKRRFMLQGWVILAVVLIFTPSIMAKDFFFTIHGLNLIADEETTDFFKAAGGGYIYTQTSGDTYFTAPIDFQSDGFFNFLAVEFMDNDATSNITVAIQRLHFASGTMQTVTSLTTGSASQSTSWQKLYAGNYAGMRAIDRENFGFYIYVWFEDGNSSLRIRQIRVKYSDGT